MNVFLRFLVMLVMVYAMWIKDIIGLIFTGFLMIAATIDMAVEDLKK